MPFSARNTFADVYEKQLASMKAKKTSKTSNAKCTPPENPSGPSKGPRKQDDPTGTPSESTRSKKKNGKGKPQGEPLLPTLDHAMLTDLASLLTPTSKLPLTLPSLRAKAHGAGALLSLPPELTPAGDGRKKHASAPSPKASTPVDAEGGDSQSLSSAEEGASLSPPSTLTLPSHTLHTLTAKGDEKSLSHTLHTADGESLSHTLPTLNDDRKRKHAPDPSPGVSTHMETEVEGEDSNSLPFTLVLPRNNRRSRQNSNASHSSSVFSIGSSASANLQFSPDPKRLRPGSQGTGSGSQASPTPSISGERPQSPNPKPPAGKLPSILVSNLPTKFAKIEHFSKALLAHKPDLDILDCKRGTHGLIVKPGDQKTMNALLAIPAHVFDGVSVNSRVLGQRPTGRENPKKAPALPTSIVLRAFPRDFCTEELRSHLRIEGVGFKYCERIVSALTDKPTPLVRLILNSHDEAKRIVDEGLRYLYLKLEAEWSNTPPQVLQCFNCQGFGHSAGGCPNPRRCVRCGEAHPHSECTTPRTQPKCANCTADHPACARSCPAFKEAKTQVASKTAIRAAPMKKSYAAAAAPALKAPTPLIPLPPADAFTYKGEDEQLTQLQTIHKILAILTGQLANLTQLIMVNGNFHQKDLTLLNHYSDTLTTVNSMLINSK